MKAILRYFLLLSLSIGSMYADGLLLRDGRMIVGQYIGGNQTEVWFHVMGNPPNEISTFAVRDVETLGFTPKLAAEQKTDVGKAQLETVRSDKNQRSSKGPSVNGRWRSFAIRATASPK